MERDSNNRRVTIMLAAFDVSVPIADPVHPQDVLMVREAVREAFQDLELRKTTIFERPITPNVLISGVRRGSIDLDVLYRAVVNLPWVDIYHNVKPMMDMGIHYVKEIGEIAGGLTAIHGMGKWIKRRLVKKEIRLEEGEPSIQLKSKVEATESLGEDAETLKQLRNRMYHEETPLTIITVVQNVEIFYRIFEHPNSAIDRKSRLGGRIIVSDLNMAVNGIENLQQIHSGEIFSINNYLALGLHFNHDRDSFYNSASSKDPDITVESVKLSSQEVPDEKQIYRSGDVDADDLEDV